MDNQELLSLIAECQQHQNPTVSKEIFIETQSQYHENIDKLTLKLSQTLKNMGHKCRIGYEIHSGAYREDICITIDNKMFIQINGDKCDYESFTLNKLSSTFPFDYIDISSDIGIKILSIKDWPFNYKHLFGKLHSFIHENIETIELHEDPNIANDIEDSIENKNIEDAHDIIMTHVLKYL